MTQEPAANPPAPEDGLLRAWIDPLLHPQFATFRRWYPRMQRRWRWRSISLAVSLLLVFFAALVLVAHDAFFIASPTQTVSLSRFIAYVLSPAGLVRLVCLCIGSVAAIYAVPTAVATTAQRGIGPYRTRVRLAFGLWTQVLPAMCALLLLSACVYLALSLFGAPLLAVYIVPLVLGVVPGALIWEAVSQALSAASGRTVWPANALAIGVVVLIIALVWLLLSTSARWLGSPVL